MRNSLPYFVRPMICLTLLAVFILLAGCSATVVGQWRNDNFQPANQDLSGPGSLTLNIRDDQTFSAIYESKDKSAKRGATGRWDQESKNAIRLIVQNGDGPQVTSAELADSNTLQLIGKGFAEKLTRD